MSATSFALSKTRFMIASVSAQTATQAVGSVVIVSEFAFFILAIALNYETWWKWRPGRLKSRLAEQSAAVSPRVAHIGTFGAAVFGIDELKTSISIDIQNFGRTSAYNVTARLVGGWFDRQPDDGTACSLESNFGVVEPGGKQSVELMLAHPITSANVAAIVRGGPGLYSVVHVDFTDSSGARRSRRTSYYLDPDRPRDANHWFMSICPTGNDEWSASSVSSAGRYADIMASNANLKGHGE